MGTTEIREPVQKRSIEKKEKIIRAGFELLCKKGYYNINTAQIAKKAGVSTGIVYNYFEDKHDILIEGIKLYSNSIFYPMLNFTNNTFEKSQLDLVLKKMISQFIENHKLSKTAHQEIMAMTYTDKNVAEIFHDSEIEITNNFANLLIENGFDNTDLLEKVHICIGLIDNLCHEIVYHKHSSMDYDKMIDLTTKIIVNILN